MRERHLKVADSITDLHKAKANRVAAELIEACSAPTNYENLHALVSLAYLKGCMDELKWAADKIGGAA